MFTACDVGLRKEAVHKICKRPYRKSYGRSLINVWEAAGFLYAEQWAKERSAKLLCRHCLPRQKWGFCSIFSCRVSRTLVSSSAYGGKGHYCKEAEGWSGAKIKASWAHGDRCAMDILYTWTRQKNGGLKHISVVLEVPLGQNVLAVPLLLCACAVSFILAFGVLS